MRLLILGSLSLVACGSTGKGLDPPTGPAQAGKLPDGPPLVTPGERMSYRLSLQGVELATFGFSVGEITELGGKRVIVVEGHAKSVGFADWVARIDDRFTSWIDVETGRSRRFQTAEYETNSKTNVEHVVAETGARQGDLVPVTFRMNEGPASEESQHLSKADVWDYNTFLVAIRAWEQPPGSKINVEVFRSRYLWNVEMTVRGKEKIKTDLPDLGEVTALRFDAHMYKLDRKGGKYPNTDERDLSIWISDDDGRVPLRTVGRTDYGDIKMDIVDYQPGSGQRLRP